MQKILFIFILLALLSCKNDDFEGAYEDVNEPYLFEIPSNFPEMHYNLEHNPLTTKGVELGRKLFYDGRLSSTNIVSCAFCHEQPHAFTHHNHNLSHGVNDRVGRRNTSATQNLAFQPWFFFDGATSNLDTVSILPIHDENEMDETIPNIIEKLSEDAAYQKLFNQAFEDGEVNSTNMMLALSQFMVIMTSSDSKYDKYVRGEPGGELTPKEIYGLELFNDKCRSCHATDLFTDHQFRNNGLPVNPNLNDKGRAEVSGDPNDDYKFKVPSLRNIELTWPYMHDGRFGSLESVLLHYRSNVQDYPNLDPILRSEDGLGIEMTDEEMEAIIEFLKTLTDYEFITNDELYFRT